MRLAVTHRAKRDARSVTQYYKRQTGSADWFLRELDAATTHLLHWPLSGEERIDLTERPVRLWLTKPYYLIYRVDSQNLTLLAIVHTARDLTQALKSIR